MSPPSGLQVIPIAGLPLIETGDDLAALIHARVAASDQAIVDGDVVAVAQKIVSKAEGRTVDLKTVTPSPRAVAIAATTHKDARHVEVILSDSVRVVRAVPNILIVEHRLGFIHANAGVDRSNVAPGEGHDLVLMLPVDPDLSARRLRARLQQLSGKTIGVLIIDSMGRAWRRGVIGTAIGSAGIRVLDDMRGQRDLFGRVLESTEVGVADELSSAASFVMGQAGESTPVVLVRGAARIVGADDGIGSLLRKPENDLFRT